MACYKEEGSDNEAVDELIGNFGSDKVPPETQERDDAPSPAPKQPSPEVDVADEMQVDQETVEADDEVSEPSADTPKGDAPPASREQSEEAQEMDELEPDIEPGPSKRAEGQALCVLPLLITVLKSTYRQAQSGG